IGHVDFVGHWVHRHRNQLGCIRIGHRRSSVGGPVNHGHVVGVGHIDFVSHRVHSNGIGKEAHTGRSGDGIAGPINHYNVIADNVDLIAHRVYCDDDGSAAYTDCRGHVRGPVNHGHVGAAV